MSTPALVFDSVSKGFESGKTSVVALEAVSISALPGKVTGLIGPDGAGKTTLMRLAVGLLLPDSGSIQVLGIDVLKAPLQVQSSVGYMPQRFGLYEDLSVMENLDLYADLQGVGREQRRARYDELLQMTALGPFTDRLAGRLSGGMKQKLGLACTLIKIPHLLLLDEPTVGVDPISRRELWAIIDRLVKQEGLSVLVSTAYLNETERCDEVVLLNEGRCLAQDSPGNYSKPMRGRTFQLSSASLDKRKLQNQLSAVPGIIDAVIDGEKVRVVTREVLPDISGLVGDDNGNAQTNALSRLNDLQIEPIEPSFEDAFIATLKVDTPLVADWFTPRDTTAMALGPVIDVVDAQRRFGDFYAVKDISFKVQQGEIFGLLGANGAGKSTLFRMLCGLLPASAGQLTVAGHDLRHAAADARSRLGYMAQRFSLYVDLTVAQNLNFFASAYGLGRALRKQRIEWAMSAFELTAYADTNSGDLALGYKQRLAMAAALLHEPDILFLDEPTSGVDPLARREFWQRINGLAASGVTVLVTTHFMDEANYCDRLVIMAEGEVLAEGTPAQMKADFRSAALPSPTMEDAFIGLIENRQKNKREVAE